MPVLACLESRINASLPAQNKQERAKVMPIKEIVISGGLKDGSAKTALYLQMEEFGDYSKKSWQKPLFRDTNTIVKHVELEEYTTEKWNSMLNPAFCGKGDNIYRSDEHYKSDVSTNEVSAGLTQSKIDALRDNIVYAIFSEPKDIFEYLKSWKGKKVDRIILDGHGYSEGFGQNEPKNTYITLNQLLQNYSRADFKDLLREDGHVLLRACSTNRDHTNKLTIAEVVSYLFNAPTTGALDTSFFWTSGLSGPSHISGSADLDFPIVAHWFDDKGLPELQNVTFTPHKTVYPNDISNEVIKYINESIK